MASRIPFTFESFGVKLSFMVMPNVPEAIAGTDFGNNETGLHIHPDDSCLIGKGVGRPGCPRDYGSEHQKNMISVGKEIAEDMLGVTPRTFVAGRWSANDQTVRALVKLGFTHDASPRFGSVSNCCDWRKLFHILAEGLGSW